jgi:hypothetical protein
MKKIEMPFEEFEAVNNARKEAEQKVVELERQLLDGVLTADPTQSLKATTELARAALDIVRFAVANNPPEMIKGWPHAKLVKCSQLIPMLNDRNPDDVDLARELGRFAAECERHELRRKNSPPVSVPPPERPEVNEKI